MLCMLSIHNASCTFYRLKMHADTANDWYCYSSLDVYSTSMIMLSIDHAYTAWYRPTMRTYMTSNTSACKRLCMLTRYQPILYVHDIDRWYVLYMLSIYNASCTFNRWNMHADTAHDRYCYSSYNIYSTSTTMLSIDNAYTAWYRSIMVTPMTSITYACMLSC